MTISWLNDQFSVRSPRRSARMTHFCSLRLTHPKNTICPQARDGASNIIHAEGVRGAVSSSAPQARKVLSLREDIWARVKTAKTGSVARRGLARILPVGKKVQPGGKGVLTWPWCWVTFGEQSMVISRERRRTGHKLAGQVPISEARWTSNALAPLPVVIWPAGD